MTLARPSPVFSAEAYLAWEAEQPGKHEYVAGEIFAMTGASDAHVTVAGNLFSLLLSHLRGGSCRVFMSDMKLRVEKANAFFYPDVFVTCDEADRSRQHFKEHPLLIAEVLSPSTSAYDRGRKFAAYRGLPSLREYVIADPESLSVDLFRKNNTGDWMLLPYVAGAEVEFASVGFKAKIESLYENVVLTGTDPATAASPAPAE